MVASIAFRAALPRFLSAAKNKGQTSVERVVYLCSLDLDPARGDELLARIRRYWDIEGGLHQRLDVSGGEDASRPPLPDLDVVDEADVGQ